MELENKKIASSLVEECFRLSISNIGKHILYPIGSDRIYLQLEQLNNLEGKSGKVKVSSLYGFQTLEVNYKIYFDEILRLEIYFGTNYQVIPLDTSEIYFGTNTYMLCACGRRCQVLYMRRDDMSYFGCRSCLNLKYELTTFNRNTQLGPYSRLLHKHKKLSEKKLAVKRIDYNGYMTRKAKSIMRLSKEINIPKI